MALPVIFFLLWCMCFVVMLTVLTPARLEWPVVRRKACLLLYGAIYPVLSSDGRFKLPHDPGRSVAPVDAKRRVVFVRHGESVWNECFNRRVDAWFLLRVLGALLQELTLLLCLDSVFLDSPLSRVGQDQARVLERYLEGEEGEELRRLCDTAVFVSSPLRRAAATALIGFARYFGGGRPLWLLSCLQD